MLAENALNIYTDGSSINTPRRGSVSIRFIRIDSTGQETVHDFCPPGYKGATNNQMELQACIIALNEAIKLGYNTTVDRIVIHSDSMYVHENYTKAMFEWPKTKWNRRSGAPVLNAPLWKELIKAIKASKKRVEIKWVKGHSKDQHNKAVDKMARQSSKLAIQPPLTQVSVRRKISPESVHVGSIDMQNQRFSIRVIVCEYLHVQKVWKLKYEVISKASPYYRNIDLIYSNILLKDGHSYHVRVNNDTRNPRIVKVFRELLKKQG